MLPLPSRAPSSIAPTPAPLINSVSPASAPAGILEDVAVIVIGQNFVSGDVIRVGGTGYTTIFTSSTKLSALVPAAVFASPTTLSVTVFRPPGGPSSNALNITVQWPVPTITSIIPNTVQQGSEDTTITITGTNYRSVSVVTFGAVTLSSVLVDQQTITAVIPQVQLQTGRTVLVAVVNPTPGGGISNNVSFAVGTNPPPPAPVLTSINPSSVQSGGPDKVVTLVGSNFIDPTTLVFSGTPIATVFGSSFFLVATIPAALIATAGIANVFLTNTNGSSNTLVFSITPAPTPPVPYLISVSPQSVQVGSGDTTIALLGLSFVNPSTAKFGATSLSTTFLTVASLTAVIPASLLVNVLNAPITVTNANGTSNAIIFSVTSPPPPPQGFPLPEFQTPPIGAGLLPGMDTVSYPVGNVPVNVNAPRWSEGNFRVADNGDVVVIFGDKFTNDTTFLVSGRDGTVLQGVLIGSIDVVNQMARVVLPSNLPTNDMYMVWPQNSIGVGEPFVVGRAEARWLNTETDGSANYVFPDIVNVHGINLSNRTAAKCWVFLYHTTLQDGVFVDPSGVNTSVSPGQVQFVPPSLPHGTYEVWLHNGHGGIYGWSKCSNNLIWGDFPDFNLNYDNNQVDLTAPAGGGASDSAKFTNALAIIGNNGPGTIALLAGTYLLGSGLTFVGGFGKPIRILGATTNPDDTVISPTALFSDSFFLHGFAKGLLENLTVDTTGFDMTGGGAPLRSLRLKNCKIICPGANSSVIDITENHPYGLFRDSQITGTGIFGNLNPGGLIDNCDLIMTNGTLIAPAVSFWFAKNWSVTNCTCADSNRLGTEDQRGNGKFFNASFTSYFMHVADNTTTDLGPLDGDGNPNSGEQINSDGELEGAGQTSFSGLVAAASNNGTGALIQVQSAPDISSLATLFVISGKGTGQWARCTVSGTNVQCDRSFRVLPDSTSTVVIRTANTEWVVSGNVLDGYAQLATASVGIEFFTSSAANVCDSNTITDTRYGLIAETKYAFHNLFSASSITSTAECAAISAMVVGSIYRNLTGTQQSEADLIIFSGPFIGAVFDTCSFTDAPKGIYDLGNGGSGDITLYQTTFSLGTGTFAGSIGQDFTGFTLTMVLSAFSGFQS